MRGGGNVAAKRISRRAAITLALGIAMSIVGSLSPGQAATEWTCQFDPPGGTVFDFNSLAGLGNDSLRIRGAGLCTTGPVNVCGVGPSRLPCDLFGRLSSATISGSATEAPGANTLHFGRCDADPAPAGAPGLPGVNPLIAAINVTIDIIGDGRSAFTRRVVWDFDLASSILCFPLCVFPGPSFQHAELFSGSERDGGLDLSTRVGGRCPPEGSDAANFLQVRFTA